MLNIKLKGNASLYTKFFFKRKGLPGCAHFIIPKVYIGKKGAVSCIGINMVFWRQWRHIIL